MDPTYTVAWNWLLHGAKRWCLLLLETPAATVLGEAIGACDDDGSGGGGGGEGEGEGEGGEGGKGGKKGDGQDQCRRLLSSGASLRWPREYSRLKAEAGALGMLEVVQRGAASASTCSRPCGPAPVDTKEWSAMLAELVKLCTRSSRCGRPPR